MSMLTDVKAAAVSATGLVTVGGGRTRIKGLWFVPSATAGSISVKVGGSGGTEVLNVATPASATASNMILIPGQGVLVEGNPYLTLTNVTSVTVFYG